MLKERLSLGVGVYGFGSSKVRRPTDPNRGGTPFQPTNGDYYVRGVRTGSHYLEF